MPSYQWIKLYIEILDDYKMFSLPNHQWRRAIELFLAAGRRNDNGKLGPVPQLAFWLHIPEDDLLKSLRTLQEIGIVDQADDGEWYVKNFTKRQSAINGAERVKQHRSRKAGDNPGVLDNEEDNEESNEDVTPRYTPPLVSSPSDSSFSQIARVYESEIGSLTKTISEELQAAVGDYPAEWIEAALKEAARNNKRAWSYALAILKRWKAEGFQSKGRKNGAATRAEIDKLYPPYRPSGS